MQKGLLPTIEKLFSKAEQSDVIFQQDNAPAHTIKTTKTWLENKSIRLMFWPGQSPDLNPTENIWPYIKHKLTGKHFSTTHQLFETTNIEWNNIVLRFTLRTVRKGVRAQTHNAGEQGLL